MHSSSLFYSCLSVSQKDSQRIWLRLKGVQWDWCTVECNKIVAQVAGFYFYAGEWSNMKFERQKRPYSLRCIYSIFSNCLIRVMEVYFRKVVCLGSRSKDVCSKIALSS